MLRLPDPATPLRREPPWPDSGPGTRPVVCLMDAATSLEHRILAAWVQRHHPLATPVDPIRIASSRSRRHGDDRLADRLERGDDPWILPLRVAWFPHERDGMRVALWRDLLKLGDPRDPDAFRQWVILARWPERLRIVVGPGASLADLRAGHAASAEARTFAEYVTRRAWGALDRSERLERGNRYKVPRFVAEDIVARVGFRAGCIRLGADRGLPPAAALARGRAYLREIAASHSTLLTDLIANAIHWLYRQGYGAIIYDHGKVREIAQLGSRHPVAFLPSHRSNLDRLALQYLLWENDLPPNHTAGGVNMDFFPVGPLLRRTGVFFIRRTFKENHLYKFVLRAYIDYLVEKRFPLEWYLEGGRSRSGKLLAPRYGLLAYVVDSVRKGMADDLHLIPTSIVYDQIQDVADYAREVRGGKKERESFTWVLRAVRSLRRRYGNIHVRFGDPVSVRKEIDGDADPDEVTIALQKLAFEVMHRIGAITPITPTAVVSMALLEAKGRACGLERLGAVCAELDAYVERFSLPTTERLLLEDPAEVEAVVERLVAHGSVSAYRQGPQPVYFLTPVQALQAGYYRNVVVHFFVPGSIAELALLRAAERTDALEAFWEEAFRLRDLLKFEFFFAEKEEFRHQIGLELADADPEWEGLLGTGPDGARALHERIEPLKAHWALLPFLDAYQVVADTLVDWPDSLDEQPFLDACLHRGEQYRLQGAITSPEGVSRALFQSALALARNRDLAGDSTRTEERRAFASEIASVRHRAEMQATEAGERPGATSATPGPPPAEHAPGTTVPPC